jgi:hypothetical protein
MVMGGLKWVMLTGIYVEYKRQIPFSLLIQRFIFFQDLFLLC